MAHILDNLDALDRWAQQSNGVNLRIGYAQGGVDYQLITTATEFFSTSSTWAYLRSKMASAHRAWQILLRGLEASKHKKNHMFWIFSWPVFALRKRSSVVCLQVCSMTTKWEKRDAGQSGFFMCMSLMSNSVCGRNQFTEDNCSFPRGEEEAMKGNERLSLHHCTHMVLMGTMIISQWIQLQGWYFRTSQVFTSS